MLARILSKCCRLLPLYKKQVATFFYYCNKAFRGLLPVATYFLIINRIYTYMHTHTHTHTHVSTKYVFFCTKWQQSSQSLDAVRFEHVAASINVATSYTKWQHL